MGYQLKVLTEHTTVEALWDEILEKESSGKIMFFVLRPSGECVEMAVRPSSVVAADPLNEVPAQPNREERRHQEAERRTLGLGAGGRVQIGQAVKKDK
jgi:hypothetical protein